MSVLLGRAIIRSGRCWLWRLDVYKSQGLHGLYQSVPQNEIKALLNTQDLLNPAQRRFVKLMRGGRYTVYYDYQKEAVANLLLDKIKC